MEQECHPVGNSCQPFNNLCLISVLLTSTYHHRTLENSPVK